MITANYHAQWVCASRRPSGEDKFGMLASAILDNIPRETVEYDVPICAIFKKGTRGITKAETPQFWDTHLPLPAQIQDLSPVTKIYNSG
jgi:hypothetical protein